MNLRIMTIGGCALPGGVALVLCNEEGVMLPCQAGAVLHQEQGETTTFTVTFEVNGRDVVLDGGPALDGDE